MKDDRYVNIIGSISTHFATLFQNFPLTDLINIMMDSKLNERERRMLYLASIH
jgi:hypothetical protein